MKYVIVDNEINKEVFKSDDENVRNEHFENLKKDGKDVRKEDKKYIKE